MNTNINGVATYQPINLHFIYSVPRAKALSFIERLEYLLAVFNGLDLHC